MINLLTEARLPLFPITTTISNQQLEIGGCSVDELVTEFGTPLYLYDRATLDDAVLQYRQALATNYPGEACITYAGKAFLCTAIAQWSQQANLWLDCTGAGELYIAANANVPRQNLLVHGVNKSRDDLKAAVELAGTIVIDNLSELKKLVQLVGGSDTSDWDYPELWFRVRPGIAVDTHRYTQTGQEDSKFGMSLPEVLQAIDLAQTAGFNVPGLHFHQGSHFHQPEPVGPALSKILDLIVEIRTHTGWLPRTLCPGGGWGVPYHEDDLPHPSVEAYVRFVANELTAGCQEREIPLPILHLEPGRSLIARAGVAVYCVGSIKQTQNRRWLLIDGGLADNPRPALYQARYSALPTQNPERSTVGPATLAGPYCESGDILIHDLDLPEIMAGETIAVPVSGAYQLSMASNYNGAVKPAVLWLDEGKATLIQRRQEASDLISFDLPLPTE